MKNMKVYTKLVIGFIIIDIMLVLAIWTGYSTAKTIITVEDPQHYLRSYQIWCAIFFVVAAAIMGSISFSVTRAIRKSTAQLSDVAHQIFKGKEK